MKRKARWRLSNTWPWRIQWPMTVSKCYLIYSHFTFSSLLYILDMHNTFSWMNIYWVLWLITICCWCVAELDSLNPKLMNESRMMRIARGAGRPIRDVMEMWEEYTSDLLRSGAKWRGLRFQRRVRWVPCLEIWMHSTWTKSSLHRCWSSLVAWVACKT